MAAITKKNGSLAAPREKREMFPVLGSSLGLKIDNLAQTTLHLRRGLSFHKLTQFQRTSLLPLESIAAVMQLPKRTMVRRKKAGRLNQVEAERLLRVALVFEKATNLFNGDRIAARDWLMAPCKGLGQVAPLHIAETELGARAVEDLIGRLEHGVFS